jgi:hypothetical protein
MIATGKGMVTKDPGYSARLHTLFISKMLKRSQIRPLSLKIETGIKSAFPAAECVFKREL